tara:strand:+ start:297 stop:1379 length:1083 start_codon:yes stop_codon:yes gene_type:complete
MIKSSKSLSALLILFLCLASASRYIQWIIFDRDILYTPITKLKLNSDECKPKEDSLISYYRNINSNVLLIIIDAFPNPKVYKDMVGTDSKLHNFLIENSQETIYVSGASQKTYSSLPYLLGKLSPVRNCRYPLFRGAIKPNILINSKNLASKDGLCSIIYNSVSPNKFIRYTNKIRAILNPEYAQKLKEESIDCSLVNTKLLDKAVDKLNYFYSKEKGSLNILHEMQFTMRSASEMQENLQDYDEAYYKSIIFLINKLKDTNKINEIIIMNDHGPRIGKSSFKSDNFEEIRLFDDMFYGIFVSRFKLSNHEKESLISQPILKKIIPSSKIRYCDDGYGNINKIRELGEIEYCHLLRKKHK